MTQAPAALPPRAAPQRHDGWTPDRQRLFLEKLAECGTVQDACRAVGMSPASAYALRQRKSGALFALGWAAALRHARERLADELLSRAMHGCTETVERGDEVITRHRFDNRLSMAMLTRLDREAEKLDDAARTVTTVADDFEALLDCVETGDTEAEAAFAAAHRRAPLGQQKPALADPGLMHTLTEAQRRRAYAAMRPEDIDTSDLDPANSEDWTADQWERAYHSGLIDEVDDGDDAAYDPFAADDDDDEDDAPDNDQHPDPDARAAARTGGGERPPEIPWHLSTSSTSPGR
ncbi:hypothetical protein [Sphingosinicella soli]|uniref:Terminase n=1 Tax=Sphingosinicella soli TaxID=333708 RepID=A0A7W7F5Z7_9SPHN|nr:hypothetical protein [Sphingosinicella soli]MBB4631866.1 hypothetical protein [Sphingosinicella soli]